MTGLTFAETQAIADLAAAFYPFLPASGARYTWREVSYENDVLDFWHGANTRYGLSKKPAITDLFKQTFTEERALAQDFRIPAGAG